MLQRTDTCVDHYRRDLDWGLNLLDHFNTRLVAVLNYSPIADLHNTR
jgi:hypothetical protein